MLPTESKKTATDRLSIVINNISLNYNEERGIKGAITELAGKYPFIKKIILYGSKARGDFREDSDIDILFITDMEVPRSVKYEIYDILYKYEFENDIVFSAVFATVEDFKRRKNLFLITVKKEGITLWSRD